MRKLSYANSTNKRNIQDKILSSVESKRVCALGGPDIEEYVSVLRKHGFEDITIFENDKVMLFKQLQKIPGGISLLYKNVLKYLNRNCFYDLDFCCSIKKIIPKLKSITSLKEYSLTVAMRGKDMTKENTIAIMKEYDPEIKYFTYRDTTPMITFYKVSKSIT